MDTTAPESRHHSGVNTMNSAGPETGNFSATVTSDTTVQDRPKLVSLLDFGNETEQDKVPPPLTVLGTREEEPVYVSLFTTQGVEVTAHRLDGTDFVHCLGKDCPACAAQLKPGLYLLLPLVDLVDATIKILRVPTKKGAGTLKTEILKVLQLPNCGEIVTKISRKKFHYTVDAVREDALNPDVTAAIKRFVEQLEAGLVDITSVVTRMSASEMLQHEGIAKRLELEGRRPSAAS
jgi:hypothetical protein